MNVPTASRTCFVLAGACVMLVPAPASAQNRGVYPLGMSSTNAGVTPAAGFTYANQLLYYARTRVKDNEGETLPGGGLNAVLMDMNILTYASHLTMLGGRYSASATIPVAKNSLTSDANGRISGGAGLADSYYLPLILGWGERRLSVRAMYGFLAPTGRFEAGADDNVGSGYWTQTLSTGQSVRLTESGSLLLSLFEMYEFHTEQDGTGIKPGDTFDMDFSLLGALPVRGGLRMHLGVAGYLARQTTARTGPEITTEQSAERYAVNGLGGALTAVIPARRLSFGLRFFQEFANRATYEGYSAQLSGAIAF